jgi:hypothetical protein
MHNSLIKPTPITSPSQEANSFLAGPPFMEPNVHYYTSSSCQWTLSWPTFITILSIYVCHPNLSRTSTFKPTFAIHFSSLHAKCPSVHFNLLDIITSIMLGERFRWPWGLRRRSAGAWLMRSGVWFSQGHGSSSLVFVCCVLITRLEES